MGAGSALEQAVILCRTMNTLVVTRVSKGPVVWPVDWVTYRGTSMPSEMIAFFTEGLVYRAPMFLASAFKKRVAFDFLKRASGKNAHVMFHFCLDPDLTC